MNSSEPAPDRSDTEDRTSVSDEAVSGLMYAIARLNANAPYFVDALTEYLLTLRPVSPEAGLSGEQERFLIESDVLTADELADTKDEINRGDLQLDAAEAFLSHLCATLSLDAAAGYLSWDEETVRTAVSERRLYGVEFSGRLRLPVWQFHVSGPSKLLPGLADVLKAASPSLHWQSMAGLMATRQSSLRAEGRKTPVDWLRDGGDVQAVIQLLKGGGWW